MFSDELLIPGLRPWSLLDDSMSFFIPSMSPWALLDDCNTRFPVTTNVKSNNLFIEVEVPRFKPEELKVEANPKTGVIRIWGSRGKGKPSFQHRLLVSPKVYDVEKQTSSLQDGVFTVTVPQKQMIAEKPQEKATTAKHPATGEMQEASEGQIAVQAPHTAAEWPPRLVRQVDGNITVYSCHLPEDVKPEDVQISFLEHGALRLRVTAQKEEKSPDSSFSEYTTWETQFPLPKDVSPSGVKAELKNGKLQIVAEAQAHEPSAIPVQVQ
jgi:HSP20 family molecular chaperone IbpA